MVMQTAHAVFATPHELALARQWFAAHFEGRQEALPPQPGLRILANHGGVEPNGRGGKPLNLAGRRYRRGLYCHAVSKVAVRLPGPGRTFTAVCGVDSNEQTSGGRGSVVFSVTVGGRQVFTSGLLREGMPGRSVSADLGGAEEFTLEVSDGGDGIACDQADWADAKVTLADGRVLWISDLTFLAERGPVTTEPPFSFIYGGRPSADLLKGWKREQATRDLDANRTVHALTWTDPQTGLVVRCVGVASTGFPTVEWTLYFKNTGTQETPLLEAIRAADIRWERRDSEFVLHHHRGDFCAANSFEPLDTLLEPKAALRFAPDGGRPSNGAWPYYNLEWDDGGVITAIGWPGQWSAAFTRDEGAGLRVSAGQETTRFVLKPGEEARSPLIALLFYDGDRARAQNLWRRWMLAENFPKPKTGALQPALTACSGWQFPGLRCNQADEIRFINRYLEEGIRLDYWWMDAGWYPCGEAGWPKVGTWEVDKERYPGGLRAVTDHAHARDMQGIVWFEPERVTPGTWLYEQHPEWLLGRNGEQKLLDLGNPQARQWLTDHIDKLLTEQGIDLYRQDFNMDPLPYWQAADAPDRQGLTENRYCAGFLAYWDELRRRHPGMLIDSCASGGRRDDLETMRRAVPLLRTDFEFQTTGNQCHTYGFDQWLPYHSLGNRDIDPYSFRSNMSPMMGFCWDVRLRDLDYRTARKLVGQWKQVAPCYLGDFWPLSPYSAADTVWMAWQFDRPDRGEGMVQAFRRPGCIYEAARFRLRNLDPAARYRIRDMDTPGAKTLTGRELMEKGLLVTIPDQPGAVIITYRRMR